MDGWTSKPETLATLAAVRDSQRVWIGMDFAIESTTGSCERLDEYHEMRNQVFKAQYLGDFSGPKRFTAKQRRSPCVHCGQGIGMHGPEDLCPTPPDYGRVRLRFWRLPSNKRVHILKELGVLPSDCKESVQIPQTHERMLLDRLVQQGLLIALDQSILREETLPSLPIHVQPEGNPIEGSI